MPSDSPKSLGRATYEEAKSLASRYPKQAEAIMQFARRAIAIANKEIVKNPDPVTRQEMADAASSVCETIDSDPELAALFAQMDKDVKKAVLETRGCLRDGVMSLDGKEGVEWRAEEVQEAEEEETELTDEDLESLIVESEDIAEPAEKPVEGKGAVEEATRLFGEAEKLYFKGKYKKALPFYESYLGYAENPVNIALAHLRISGILDKRRDEERAGEHYKKALEGFEKSVSDPSGLTVKRRVTCLQGLSDIRRKKSYYTLYDIQKAYEWEKLARKEYEAIIGAWEKGEPADPALVALAYNNLALLAKEEGSKEECERIFKQGRGAIKNAGRKNPVLLDNYCVSAGLLSHNWFVYGAMPLLIVAAIGGIVEWRTKVISETINHTRGVIKSYQGKWATEDKDLGKAERILKSSLDLKIDDRDKATLYNNYAIALSGQGKHQEAYEAIKTAIKLNPQDAQFQEALETFRKAVENEAIKKIKEIEDARKQAEPQKAGKPRQLPTPVKRGAAPPSRQKWERQKTPPKGRGR